MTRSAAHSGVLVGLRKVLRARIEAIGETRTTLPLSLVFASLLVSCEPFAMTARRRGFRSSGPSS
jgi:hypothetical protein